MTYELNDFFEGFKKLSETEKKHFLRLILTEFSDEQLLDVLSKLDFNTREFIYDNL